jgi:hypothetical protein
MWNICPEKPQATSRANPMRARKPTRTGLSKLVGAHIIVPHALGEEHGAIGFNVCTLYLRFSLVCSFLAYCLSLLLKWECFTLCYCTLEICNFLFDFTGAHN